MGQYVRMVGTDFLISIINPLLVAVAAEDKDLEVSRNPSNKRKCPFNNTLSLAKLDTFRAENVTENQLQTRVQDLGKICTVFMDRVFSVCDQCPL